MTILRGDTSFATPTGSAGGGGGGTTEGIEGGADLITIDATDLRVLDAVVDLKYGDTANIKDVGWQFQTGAGYTGFIWDASASEFVLPTNQPTPCTEAVANYATAGLANLRVNNLNVQGAINAGALSGPTAVYDRVDTDFIRHKSTGGLLTWQNNIGGTTMTLSDSGDLAIQADMSANKYSVPSGGQLCFNGPGDDLWCSGRNLPGFTDATLDYNTHWGEQLQFVIPASFPAATAAFQFIGKAGSGNHRTLMEVLGNGQVVVNSGDLTVLQGALKTDTTQIRTTSGTWTLRNSAGDARVTVTDTGVMNVMGAITAPGFNGPMTASTSTIDTLTNDIVKIKTTSGAWTVQNSTGNPRLTLSDEGDLNIIRNCSAANLSVPSGGELCFNGPGDDLWCSGRNLPGFTDATLDYNTHWGEQLQFVIPASFPTATAAFQFIGKAGSGNHRTLMEVLGNGEVVVNSGNLTVQQGNINVPSGTITATGGTLDQINNDQITVKSIGGTWTLRRQDTQILTQVTDDGIWTFDTVAGGGQANLAELRANVIRLSTLRLKTTAGLNIRNNLDTVNLFTLEDNGTFTGERVQANEGMAILTGKAYAFHGVSADWLMGRNLIPPASLVNNVYTSDALQMIVPRTLTGTNDVFNSAYTSGTDIVLSNGDQTATLPNTNAMRWTRTTRSFTRTDVTAFDVLLGAFTGNYLLMGFGQATKGNQSNEFDMVWANIGNGAGADSGDYLDNTANNYQGSGGRPTFAAGDVVRFQNTGAGRMEVYKQTAGTGPFVLAFFQDYINPTGSSTLHFYVGDSSANASDGIVTLQSGGGGASSGALQVVGKSGTGNLTLFEILGDGNIYVNSGWLNVKERIVTDVLRTRTANGTWTLQNATGDSRFSVTHDGMGTFNGNVAAPGVVTTFVQATSTAGLSFKVSGGGTIGSYNNTGVWSLPTIEGTSYAVPTGAPEWNFRDSLGAPWVTANTTDGSWTWQGQAFIRTPRLDFVPVTGLTTPVANNAVVWNGDRQHLETASQGLWIGISNLTYLQCLPLEVNNHSGTGWKSLIRTSGPGFRGATAFPIGALTDGCYQLMLRGIVSTAGKKDHDIRAFLSETVSGTPVLIDTTTDYEIDSPASRYWEIDLQMNIRNGVTGGSTLAGTFKFIKKTADGELMMHADLVDPQIGVPGTTTVNTATTAYTLGIEVAPGSNPEANAGDAVFRTVAARLIRWG